MSVSADYLHRLSLDKPAAITLWQPGELDRPSVRVVGGRELLVEKLLALLDRGSPRDAWDVAALPESMRELLGQHPDAQELAARAWTAVAPLVHLSPDEAAYFAAIDEGELRLELLFPEEPAEAARLTAHPALQWKLANLGRRPKGRGGSRET